MVTEAAIRGSGMSKHNRFVLGADGYEHSTHPGHLGPNAPPKVRLPQSESGNTETPTLAHKKFGPNLEADSGMATRSSGGRNPKTPKLAVGGGKGR